MADALQYSKTCQVDALCINRWQKAARLMVSFSYVQCYTAERKRVYVESLLVMRESAIALFTHTSEPSSMEWEHRSSPRTLSASKVMDSVFWIHRMYCRWSSWNMDVHLTLSSESHWKACHGPSGECPSLLSDSPPWQRLAAHSTAKLWIRNSGPYSPHLAPIDFIYFPNWMITYHNIVSPMMKTSSMLKSHKVLSILDGWTYHMLWQVPQLSSGLC